MSRSLMPSHSVLDGIEFNQEFLRKIHELAVGGRPDHKATIPYPRRMEAHNASMESFSCE